MSNNSLKSFNMTFYVTRIAMLTAVATLFMMFDFPIPIFPGFYKFDFSYFPVVIASFSMGPIAGIITAVLKDLIAFIIAGTFTESAGIGAIADICIGLSFIVPAGLIYKKKHTKKGALLALGAALITSTIFSCAFNYWFLIPTYSRFFGMDTVIAMAQKAVSFIKDIKGVVVFGTLPFNVFKWVIISLLTIFSYKPLSSSILKKKNKN